MPVQLGIQGGAMVGYKGSNVPICPFVATALGGHGGVKIN